MSVKIIDFIKQSPIKWTPLGWLDKEWQFETLEEARKDLTRIGYIEPMKGRFVQTENKNWPVYLKVVEDVK